MPCVGFAQTLSPQSLVRIASSRLARHITDVNATLTSNEICLLAFSMPHLKDLRCAVTPSDAQQMLLPPKLETLSLNLSKLDAAEINTIMQSIGRLTTFRSLMLRFASWLPVVSFAPLSKCAALTKLMIRGPLRGGMPGQPTDAHIDQLRALHHLLSVSIDGLDGSSLTELLRTPHSLEWTELHDVYGIDAASASAIRNLPGLLQIDRCGCGDVSFLPALAQLQTLRMSIWTKPWAVTGDAVVEALSGHRLTILDLKAPITSAHLSALLPRLPLLHTLSLGACSELESLQFLSDVPALQHTLRAFFLNNQPALRSAEMRHVLGLKNLERLRLWSSFSEPLDGLTQHLLTPPSTVLPKLTEFDYDPADAAVA